jgi:hypothetical protein
VKQEKGVFHLQHLMSRRPVGMQIQVALTLFAANFVGGAAAWLRGRVRAGQRQVEAGFASVKRLVRVGANSPALVEQTAGQITVRFGPLSSLGGVVIALTDAAIQLELPLFAPVTAPALDG